MTARRLWPLLGPGALSLLISLAVLCPGHAAGQHLLIARLPGPQAYVLGFAGHGSKLSPSLPPIKPLQLTSSQLGCWGSRAYTGGVGVSPGRWWSPLAAERPIR